MTHFGSAWASDFKEPTVEDDIDNDGMDEPQVMSARPRVFIAEDDPDQRALIEHALAKDGYEVIEANDGLELLDRLQDALETPIDMPDLIITDIVMPMFSGMAILEALRHSNWVTPVIIVSARHDEELRT